MIPSTGTPGKYAVTAKCSADGATAKGSFVVNRGAGPKVVLDPSTTGPVTKTINVVVTGGCLDVAVAQDLRDLLKRGAAGEHPGRRGVPQCAPMTGTPARTHARRTTPLTASRVSGPRGA